MATGWLLAGSRGPSSEARVGIQYTTLLESHYFYIQKYRPNRPAISIPLVPDTAL